MMKWMDTSQNQFQLVLVRQSLFTAYLINITQREKVVVDDSYNSATGGNYSGTGTG